MCAILTMTDTFAAENPARTDIKLSVLTNSPWVRVPYPGLCLFS